MSPLIGGSSAKHRGSRRGGGPGPERSKADGPITRDDIEAKLRGLQADVTSEVEAARPKLLVAGAALVVGVSVAFYLMGRRRGKKRSTVVEIRRV